MTDIEADIDDMRNRCDWIAPENHKLPGLCDYVRTLLNVAESQRFMLHTHERYALLSVADEVVGMMERRLEDDAVTEAESYLQGGAS